MKNVNLDLVEGGFQDIGEAIVKLTDSLDDCGVEDIEVVKQINKVIVALCNGADELEVLLHQAI